MTTRTVYKSAISGLFVSKEYAQNNPETTFSMEVEDHSKPEEVLETEGDGNMSDDA